jgi:hypothetical protein
MSWRIFGGALDKGDVEVHPAGVAPRSKLGAEWIDFEKYSSVCA